MSTSFGAFNDLNRFQRYRRQGIAVTPTNYPPVAPIDERVRRQQLLSQLKGDSPAYENIGDNLLGITGLDEQVESVFDEFEERVTEQLPFGIALLIGVLGVIVAMVIFVRG